MSDWTWDDLTFKQQRALEVLGDGTLRLMHRSGSGRWNRVNRTAGDSLRRKGLVRFEDWGNTVAVGITDKGLAVLAARPVREDA